MRNKIKLRFTALTDIGCVKTSNEDSFGVSTSVGSKTWAFSDEIVELRDNGAAVIVADGMGSTNTGRSISDIAVKSVIEEFSNIANNVVENESRVKAFLSNSFKMANSTIMALYKADNDSCTTLVVGWLLGEYIYVAWCGDSRAYVYHPIQGLRQLSKDHTYVQRLFDKEKITKEEAFYHHHSNIITRVLENSDKNTTADVVQFPLVKGCRFLLCTDGLNRMIQDSKIEEIILDNVDIVECRDRFISEAKYVGGNDNITVLVVDVCEGLNISKLPPLESKKVTAQSKRKFNIAKITIYSLILALVIGGVFWIGIKL